MLKEKIKKISEKLNIKKYTYGVWFYLLSKKYNVKTSFLSDKIKIKKDNKSIFIKGNMRKTGSLGLVIRDFENIFNTVVCENENGHEIVDFSVTQVHQLKEDGKKFMFQDICEPLSVTKLYLEYGNLKNGDVVFDIGSYAGTQTVYFSEIVGAEGKVFAFEPDKRSYEILVDNLKENNCNNVIALNIGLYDKDGVITFSDSGLMGSKIVEGNSLDKGGVTSINVNKIDTILQKYDIEKVNFIKMDIEGAETNVLESSLEFIKKFRPRFIIEPHFIDGKLNSSTILNIFKEVNYECQLVKQGDFDYQPLIYAYPNK